MFVSVMNDKKGDIFVTSTVDDDYKAVKCSLKISKAESEGGVEAEVEAEAEVESERGADFWHESHPNLMQHCSPMNK